MPTTAGTGSEATLVAVVANPALQVKMEFLSYHLLPDVAVLDPRMTETLPPRITASTGFDALVHAIEAATCLQRNPVSDSFAERAIRQITQSLPRAVKNGRDRRAHAWPWPTAACWPGRPFPTPWWVWSTPSATPWAGCAMWPMGTP
ncbi:MAG: iron-containing alcohol dehydrogenase [Evtepia gabavorous]